MKSDQQVVMITTGKLWEHQAKQLTSWVLLNIMDIQGWNICSITDLLVLKCSIVKVSKQGVIPTQATAWPVADHQLHNMKVQRKKRFGDSDLAKTLLRINPAVDKKVKGTLDILTKTQFKGKNSFSRTKNK